MTRQTRRTVLSSVAGAIAFAGCSETESGGHPDTFERVAVDGTQLLIDLDSPAADHSLSVIDPQGELFAEVSLNAGETRIPIELGLDYTPGEFEIHLLNGDDNKGRTSLDIRPELEIVDFGVGVNAPERMPDEVTFPNSQVFVVVRNTGTGPDKITHLRIEGSVPNPTSEEGSKSGIFDEEEGLGHAESVIVPTGSDVELFSIRYPFIGYERYCESGDIELGLDTEIGDDVLRRRFSVAYQQDGGEDCSVTVEETD